MNIFCVEKYYTLDKIPEYRRQFIDIKIEWLIKELNLKASDWPLDSIKLLDRIIDSGIIHLAYGFTDLSDNVDGVAEYNQEHDVHLMQINKNKIKKSLENYIAGRPNFTVWHEMGHPILGHNLIPEHLKTQEEKNIEELEADEFAGRFLMPQWLLFSCNYRPTSKVTEYLLVSKTALWRRLNNLKSLNTLKSERVNTCTVCGNTRFSSSAEYCGICGHSVKSGLNGIRRVGYSDDYVTDRVKKATVCRECVHFSGHRASYNCILCSKHVYNHCMSYFGQGPGKCTHTCFPTHRFCEKCGRPTYYYEMNFLQPWQEIYDIPKMCQRTVL